MATFGRLTDLVKNGLELDNSGLFFRVFDQNHTKIFIVYLNTEFQLFDGVNAKGVPLDDIGGSYAESTIKRKARKGQPTDRVTLKDKGDFYKTFSVDVFDDELYIEASTLKGSFNLTERWGDDLIGLTDPAKLELVQFVLPDVRKFVLNWLLNGKQLF